MITISYKIEKGIPFEDVQPHRKTYKRKSRFDVLNKMEATDSIVVSSKRELAWLVRLLHATGLRSRLSALIHASIGYGAQPTNL